MVSRERLGRLSSNLERSQVSHSRTDSHLNIEVLLHVRTCAPLICISETAGPIKLKSCMLASST